MSVILRRATMLQGREIVPPANQIWYDADAQVTLNSQVNVISHTFENGRGIITFGNDISAVSNWLRMKSVINVYLPNGITEIGGYSFSDCRNLTSINLPKGITKIGTACFSRCYLLLLTELPNGITRIEDNTFGDCREISIAKLPIGIKHIGYQAFMGCEKIPSLTIPIITPPTTGGSMFRNTDFPIYVPAESVDTYKTTDGWSAYADRIFAIPE